MLDIDVAAFKEIDSALSLGTVDLSGLTFIQFEKNLIAARVFYHSHFIKKASNNE